MKMPDLSFFLMVVLCTALFIFLVHKFKALTVSGTVSAVVLGLLIISCAGFNAIWPLVIFLAGSILTGRIKPESPVRSDHKSSRPRDAVQVWSNGGIYGIAAFLYAITGDYYFLICMAVSISVSTADTWSSETGTRLGGFTFDPFRLRKVSPGVSGGMSFSGTMAGITGAAIMAVMTNFIFGFISKYLLVFAAGITGMLLDTFLGSQFQKKYLDQESGEWVDTSKTYSDERGLSFVTNDFVNLLSNLITTVIFYFVA